MDALRSLLDGGDPVVAVVGATDDPSKYGSRVYRDLKAKGYRVRAVNPNRATVDGDPAFADLRSLPEVPDLVDVVVPPSEAVAVVAEAVAVGAGFVWLQPGAESPEAMALLEAAGVPHLANACIMVRSRNRAPRRGG